MNVGRRLLTALILMFSSPAVMAQNANGENSAREFVMSCTYGVLAGTLVGAASLAFTKKPGENLNRVARGASLGLYTGILLGFYVIYVVPGMEKESDEDPVAKIPWRIEPTVGARDNLDGAQLGYQLSF
jgi:hypothetical protein